MTKQFKFWCKGTSSNLNFNKKCWWTFPDFILSKYYDGLSIFESEDFVACQWTGLTDCNGRKIFEGDFVKGSRNYWVNDDCFEDFAEILEVKFGPLDYCEAPAFRFVTKDGCDLDFYGGPPSQDQMIIVGNIFENPELLN